MRLPAGDALICFGSTGTRAHGGGVPDGEEGGPLEHTNGRAPRIDIDDYRRISDERMPFARALGLEIDAIGADAVRMRAVYDTNFLRPGGTIAGPIMMGLADAALYALVLSRIGPVELAVTTQLSINFLRRPLPGDLVAEARMLKLGKRLAVGEVSMWSAAELGPDGVGAADAAVAHATGTYSIPPPAPGETRA